MVDNFLAQITSLGVQVHDGLLKNCHFFVNIRFLCVHLGRFLLRLHKRSFKHIVLLIEVLLFSHNLLFLLIEHLKFSLDFVQLFIQAI